MNYSTDSQGGKLRHVFDISSLDEARAIALRDPHSAEFRPAGYPSPHPQWSHEDGESADRWHGESWDGAARMANEGWPAGCNKIAELSAQIFALCAGSRRMASKLRRAAAGFSPCVSAAISGNPESMFDVEKREVMGHGGKIITIVQNVFVSSGCSPESVMDRGIVAAALVDCLEVLGHRVEFQWTCGGSASDWNNSPCYMLIRFPLKFAQDAVSFDSLSTWVAHPACFRRLGFALMEQVDRRFHPGRSSYFNPDDHCLPNIERGDLFIGSANYHDTGEAACAKLLVEYLKKLGVEFDS